MKLLSLKKSYFIIMGTVLCCTHSLLTKSKNIQSKNNESTVETITPKESKIFKNPIVKEYVHLAKSHHQDGNYDKALEFYLKAISLDAYNFNALMGVATIAFLRKEFDHAIEYYETIINHYPRCISAHYNLGLCYLHNKRYEEAMKSLEKTVESDPQHHRAWYALGTVLESHNDFVRAIDAYKRALSLEPSFNTAYFKLGMLYKHGNDFSNAISYLEKAHTLEPENNHITMELANTFNSIDENDKALQLYIKIIESDPQNNTALYNCGFTLKKKNLTTEAITIYEKVIAQNPQYARAHLALAHALLSLGNFERGFKEYEWRFAAYDEPPSRYAYPRWNGSDLINKTILVYAEQSLGDTLQFVRYLPILREKGAQVIFQTQNNLKTLLCQSPHLGTVIDFNEDPPACDFQIPLMSLPYVLKTTVDTIPAPVAYLNANKHLTAYWNSYLAHDSNLKIGICWHGSGRYSSQALQKTVEKKSIPLALLAELSAIPGVTLYSLQRVDGLDQCKDIPKNYTIHYFGPEFDVLNGSFMDSAAVIKNLDLVISVDTAIGHLAGALGVPTWILVPHPADWRWFIHRSDNPWYPTARIFRQTEPDNWLSVLSLLKHNVQLLVNHKKKVYDLPKIDSLETLPLDHDISIDTLFSFNKGIYENQ